MIDNMRRYETMPPFEYNGHVISALIYYKGNSQTAHSWDIVATSVNISKMTQEERLAIGFTDEDMLKLDVRVASYVRAKEGW